MAVSSMFRGTSHWMKQNLPAPMFDGTRGGIQKFGEVTARVRLLPNFIVVGAQRSGTTSLYRMLASHPAVLRPTMAKGIGYFDLNYDRGMRWYRAHFPLALNGRRRYEGVERTVFESSGYYSFHPLAAERMGRDLPGIKLLMMLRDPVERAYSAHRHELMRGFETEDFPHALDLEADRVSGEAERIVAQPGYDSFHLRHHAYMGRGRYAEQIRRIRDAVGGSNLYLLDADAFFADPRDEFAALQDWLGLPQWQPAHVKAENAQPRSPMEVALRQQLMDYFDPYDRDLVELLNRVPSWRRLEWGNVPTTHS